jgi:hypothetical protein
MLRSVNNLAGFTLGAQDGEFGSVYSLLFDSVHWTVRYFVVDTGRWLPGRRVLIPPSALDRPDWQDRIFPVHLTKAQICDSPEVDTDKPISRQREIELYRHYGWTPYWSPIHGLAVAPERAGEAQSERGTAIPVETPDESALRSTRDVRGYHLRATDGRIGHVEDFIISDEDWVIRYLVVDTGNWLPGRRVLVAPEWVKDIDWENRTVWVDVRKQTVEESPPYDPGAPVNREYETQMYDYYGRPKYWT